MKGEKKSYGSLSRWYEAMMWAYAAGLAVIAWRLPEPPAYGSRETLFWLAASFIAAALLFYRVMPARSEKGLRFGEEDKTLVVGLTIFGLITAFLLVAGSQASYLVYLYLLPLFAVTVLLNENLVLICGACVLGASLFLREAWRVEGPFFSFDFLSSFLVLVGASVVAAILTRELGAARRKVDFLADELSKRLDQMQTVGIIVRQVELFTRLETLLAKLSEIIANAFDAERAGILLTDKADGGPGRAITSDGAAGQWLEVSRNAQVLEDILKKGESRLFGAGDRVEPIVDLIGNPHIHGMMIVPLKVRETAIGALFVINKRSGDFAESELDFLEILAGYSATLIDSSLLFQNVNAERENAEKMSRLMVGRELQMRDLKKKVNGDNRHETAS